VLTVQHRTVWRRSPDSPVFTRQSGARSAQLVALGFLPGCVGYKSPDSPHEASDSPVLQPCNASCHVGKCHRSYGAPDGLVPHRKGRQPIRGFSAASGARTVHYRWRTRQSGAPATREGWELPNEAPMALRPFGTIKGTPRRLQQ
jgi:hypothetical protein